MLEVNGRTLCPSRKKNKKQKTWKPSLPLVAADKIHEMGNPRSEDEINEHLNAMPLTVDAMKTLKDMLKYEVLVDCTARRILNTFAVVVPTNVLMCVDTTNSD